MKKATLVLATAVAFLLSGTAFAARKVVDMPTTGSILTGSTSTLAENGVLKVSGSALVGEYIPGVKNALAIVPETKIASSAISNLAKGAVRGGLVGVAGTVVVAGMLEGLDWVMSDGVVSKKAGSPTTPMVYVPSGSQYSWSGPNGSGFPSAASACPSSSPSGWGGSLSRVGVSQAGFDGTCYYTGTIANPTGEIGDGSLSRTGDQCPSNSVFSVSAGGCVSTSTKPVPLVSSDLDVLDGFVKGKDGVWQRDLTTTLCQGSEDCYKSLSPQTSLTGPSQVTGSPQTITTTSPSGAVSTSVKTPTSTITYGPNYYDYTTTTTTTNNNGGDTTTVTDDTDTSFPVPPDIFGGANDGIGGVRDGIPTTASTTNPIPYMAWWSFSQSCSEITFKIPVYGSVTTALCPIYKQYIWPVLYFFFAVYTWLTCFEIWRKTVMRVRAS